MLKTAAKSKSSIPSRSADSDAANEKVQLSTEVPRYVMDHLEKAAGIGTRAAMARKVLVDWSEANKASR